MKNKKRSKKSIIAIVIASVALLLLLSVVVLMTGKEVSTGRCLVADNGKVLWIDDGGSPVELIDRAWFGLPENLETGDRIWLIHADAIAESYPGQVGAYFCIKIEDGSISDIPSGTISSLKELGWIKTDESVSNIGGVDGPSEVIVENKLLISSDEYYAYLTQKAEDAIKDTCFQKYSIGISEYPYFDIVFVLGEKIEDSDFFEAADTIAKRIYNELIAIEFETPPIYKYSYNNLSIEFYTEANRNQGANCCYQIIVDELDKNKNFEENVTLLTQQG